MTAFSPLPEKKHKSPKVNDSRKGSREKDDSKKEILNNNHVSKSANEAPLKHIEVPSEHDQNNSVDLVDPLKPSQNESSQNSAVQLTPNSVLNNAMNVSCDSTPAALTVKDNSTVIPQKESLDQNIVQSEKVAMESKESMPVVPAIQTNLKILLPICLRQEKVQVESLIIQLNLRRPSLLNLLLVNLAGSQQSLLK
eukprot:TRINITY_DN14153_c0_g1_i1.p1 TRINITY_DN14153_c0_g1~~TRINITY_DN14153_c0_g1_i1.p1  ORF type:complete len:196 (+),score=42.54 TRINITY_DN14153_c0_g1_i1:113-700(+)